MLKVNVGLSRKLSRDYNSHGFTINLEGEVAANLSDAEGVITRVQEFYDTAEEALLRQIERHESDTAIASHDDASAMNGAQQQRPTRPPVTTTPTATPPTPRQTQPDRTSNGPTEPATNKQVQFLLNLSKRYGLSQTQLEGRIADILGRSTGVYDLNKRDAGVVLDTLTADAKAPAARR